MKILIFDFDDYKTYLNAYIKGLPRRGYGFKSRMAEAMNCNTAYVAQVLNGPANFSLEQAEEINTTLGHSDLEGEYFLLLVQLARAGSAKLRRRTLNHLEALRERQLNLKQRFHIRDELGESELIKYFSRWYVCAVHLAITIPQLRTRQSIMKALDIEESLLEEALDFLMTVGLIKEVGSHLEPGPSRIFIGKDSPILKMHHINWRNRSILSLDNSSAKDLHFTSLYSLSAKDAAHIQEKLIREIEYVRGKVKESPEEQLNMLIVDFYRVDQK